MINLTTIDLVKEIEYCGTRCGRKIDKFKKTKLTPVTAECIGVPLIDECPVNIECRVVDKVPIGTYRWFVGEAVAVHVEKCIWNGELVNIDKAPTISYYWDHYRSPGGKVILERKNWMTKSDKLKETGNRKEMK